jgi:folate-binding Fe-S cluster repair protein YgfZ
VARALRRLIIPADLNPLPATGDKLLADGKEVGHLTSVIPGLGLGYVRKEHYAPATQLILQTAAREVTVEVALLPR